MGIRKETDDSRDLIVFVLEGKVTAEEIVQTIDGYWTHDPVARNTLWKGDVDASISHFTGDDLRTIASVVSRYRDRTGLRRGGKTAIVAPADIDFGLSRIIEALHINLTPELPYGFRVFRSEDEALDWIDE